MFESIFILIILWSWTISMFKVDRRVVYLRNGNTINTKGAGKVVCYAMLTGVVYLTGSFIFKHVLPLF